MLPFESVGYLSPTYQFPGAGDLSAEDLLGANGVGSFGATPDEWHPVGRTGPSPSPSPSPLLSYSDTAHLKADHSGGTGRNWSRVSHRSYLSASSDPYSLLQPTVLKGGSSAQANRSSFVPIAPLPSADMLPQGQGASLSHPTPTRRSSLLPSAVHAPVRQLLAAYDTRLQAMPPHKKSHYSYEEGMAEHVAASLTAQSPALAASPEDSKFTYDHARSALMAEPQFDNPLMMLHWLSQVDLSRFGFMDAGRHHHVNAPKPEANRIPVSSFSVPAADQYSRIEDDFMAAVRRKSQTRKVPSSSPDIFALSPSPASLQALSRRSPAPVTPKSSKSGSLPSSPPKGPSTPRVPYKGRFGLHPTCGSCKTTKTPYWRDSWSTQFILCNACGLRYSKFRRYCNSCNYVPRKEDKGAPCCTQCSSPWSFKV